VLPACPIRGVNRDVSLSMTRKKVQIALTVLGLSGVILPFVPFIDDLKPFSDVLLSFDFPDALWLLAVPCIVLPLPISLAYVQWLVTGRLPRWASLAAYVLSALFVTSSLAGLTIAIREQGDTDFSLSLLSMIYVAAFAGAAWCSFRSTRPDSTDRGLVLIQSVYVAPMTYFVVDFGISDGIEYFEVGAQLGAVTILAYLVQLAFAARRPRSLFAILVPVAAIAILVSVAPI